MLVFIPQQRQLRLIDETINANLTKEKDENVCQ